jgi:hypothetical protein
VCRRREEETMQATGAGLRGAYANDPVADWMAHHPEELEVHQGKDVAFHVKLGIVASGDSLAEVISEVKRRGFAPSDIIYDFIPDQGK